MILWRFYNRVWVIETWDSIEADGFSEPRPARIPVEFYFWLLTWRLVCPDAWFDEQQWLRSLQPEPDEQNQLLPVEPHGNSGSPRERHLPRCIHGDLFPGDVSPGRSDGRLSAHPAGHPNGGRRFLSQPLQLLLQPIKNEHVTRPRGGLSNQHGLSRATVWTK